MQTIRVAIKGSVRNWQNRIVTQPVNSSSSSCNYDNTDSNQQHSSSSTSHVQKYINTLVTVETNCRSSTAVRSDTTFSACRQYDGSCGIIINNNNTTQQQLLCTAASSSFPVREEDLMFESQTEKLDVIMNKESTVASAEQEVAFISNVRRRGAALNEIQQHLDLDLIQEAPLNPTGPAAAQGDNNGDQYQQHREEQTVVAVQSTDRQQAELQPSADDANSAETRFEISSGQLYNQFYNIFVLCC